MLWFLFLYVIQSNTSFLFQALPICKINGKMYTTKEKKKNELPSSKTKLYD